MYRMTLNPVDERTRQNTIVNKRFLVSTQIDHKDRTKTTHKLDEGKRVELTRQDLRREGTHPGKRCLDNEMVHKKTTPNKTTPNEGVAKRTRRTKTKEKRPKGDKHNYKTNLTR